MPLHFLQLPETVCGGCRAQACHRECRVVVSITIPACCTHDQVIKSTAEAAHHMPLMPWSHPCKCMYDRARYELLNERIPVIIYLPLALPQRTTEGRTVQPSTTSPHTCPEFTEVSRHVYTPIHARLAKPVHW